MLPKMPMLRQMISKCQDGQVQNVKMDDFKILRWMT